MLHERARDLFRRLRSKIAELPAGEAATLLHDLHDLQVELERYSNERQGIQEELLEHTAELEKSRRQLETEIAQRIAAEDRALHVEYHDALTNLPNRWLLMDRLKQCIWRAQRNPNHRYAVLLLDFDNFRRINESLGQDAGDALLVQVAERLVDCVRGLDTVMRNEEDATARLGGDEFSILLEGLRRPSDAVLVAERIKQHLSPPFSLNGHEVVMSSSVGIASSNGEQKTVDELLREADTAMYRAKRAGKARHAVFDRQMHDEAMARLRLENDLRAGVERNEFELWYQPIVELESGHLAGFEALIRWMHPERGLVSPLEFIPAAEESGLIVPIGRWVLQQACTQLSAWNSQLRTGRELSISVNVSKRQMQESGFVKDVRHILQESGGDGLRLNLEITESVVIGDSESIMDVLVQLRELGLELHMDDFGTGLSSLSCLHQFPIDVLKIDQTFVATMIAKREYAAVVHAVTTLAHNLEMKVIAEGIETPEQLAQMIALECDFGQGYLFSKPVNATGASELIAEGQFSLPVQAVDSPACGSKSHPKPKS